MLTIVLSYYDNGGILDRHLEEWAGYPESIKPSLRAIVVDDGSPNDPAARHLRGVGFPVEIYRIKTNTPWNVPGARNLGMHMAQDGWVLLTDIDHLLEREYAALLVNKLENLHPSSFYLMSRKWADGRPLNSHGNSYVLQRSLYWIAGGTDEDWSGFWGAGESAFRKALGKVGRAGNLPDIYLTHYGRDDIPDASTREWGRRDSEYDWRRNPALVAKMKAGTAATNPLRFTWERVA